MTNRTKAASISVAVASVILLFGTALPAQAAQEAPAVLPGQSASQTSTSDDCLTALPAGEDASICSITTTITLGDAQQVTEASVLADKGLSSSDKASIIKSLDAGILASNHWSQFATGGAYTQTQNGQFYYDGSRAWVTQTFNGQTGSHACFTNYVTPGWGISNVSKSDSGGTSRSLHCGWNVNQPGGFQTYFDMTAVIAPNGTISGFGSSIG